MNVHLDHTDKVARMADMGAKWVRIDMNWEIMEPSQNQWEFEIFDRTIEHAKANGMKVFATLAYAPSWASSNGRSNGVPDPQGWKNFVRTAVNRYKGKVDVFGIWNEANLHEFWVGTAAEWTDVVLKPACEIIRGIDPSIRISGPDLAHLYEPTIGQEAFLKTIRDHGAAHCIDIFAHHVYATTGMKERLFGYYAAGVLYKPGLKQWLERSGFWGKPVWITEFGHSVKGSTEELQAKYVTEQVSYLSTIPWIHKAFVFELTDDPRPEAPYQMGITRADGSLRPVFFDLQRLIQQQGW